MSSTIYENKKRGIRLNQDAGSDEPFFIPKWFQSTATRAASRNQWILSQEKVYDGGWGIRVNYGVAAVETGGKQMSTGYLHLDRFESLSPQ